MYIEVEAEKLFLEFRKEEQEDFIKKIETKNSPITKVYNLIVDNKPLDWSSGFKNIWKGIWLCGYY